jgi:hypothetical protein
VVKVVDDQQEISEIVDNVHCSSTCREKNKNKNKIKYIRVGNRATRNHEYTINRADCTKFKIFRKKKYFLVLRLPLRHF